MSHSITRKNCLRLFIGGLFEEAVYMYYLDSRVTVGYVGNNLSEDLKISPDIIIWRKRPAYTNNVFAQLIGMASYKKFSFPVVDYYFNNIAETRLHLFKTPLVQDQSR